MLTVCREEEEEVENNNNLSTRPPDDNAHPLKCEKGRIKHKKKKKKLGMIYLACAVLLSPSDRRCCRGCCKPATAKDRGGLFVWILLQLIGYMLAAAVLGCRWTQSVTTGAKKGVNQEVGQTVCWGLSAAQRRAQSDVGG